MKRIAFLCYLVNISMLNTDTVSTNEVADEHEYIGPHILGLYNDFYDQQMMAYDTFLQFPEAYSVIDTSQYDLYYPMMDSLYMGPAISAEGLTYIEEPIATMRLEKQTKPVALTTQCQHPKHDSYAMLANASLSTVTPRRGRPPKGSKTTDCYEMAQLKRLPKRLEPVVGRQDISRVRNIHHPHVDAQGGINVQEAHDS
jgi:hypothetical protein